MSEDERDDQPEVTSSGTDPDIADTLEGQFETDRDTDSKSSVWPTQAHKKAREYQTSGLIRQLGIHKADILDQNLTKGSLYLNHGIRNVLNSPFIVSDKLGDLASSRFTINPKPADGFWNKIGKNLLDSSKESINITLDLLDYIRKKIWEAFIFILPETLKSFCSFAKNIIAPSFENTVNIRHTQVIENEDGKNTFKENIIISSADAMAEKFGEKGIFPRKIAKQDADQIQQNFAAYFPQIEDKIKTLGKFDDHSRIALAASIGAVLARTISKAGLDGSVVTIQGKEYDLLNQGDVGEFIKVALPDKYGISVVPDGVDAKNRGQYYADQIQELFTQSGMDIDEFAQIVGGNLEATDKGTIITIDNEGKPKLLEQLDPDILVVIYDKAVAEVGRGEDSPAHDGEPALDALTPAADISEAPVEAVAAEPENNASQEKPDKTGLVADEANVNKTGGIYEQERKISDFKGGREERAEEVGKYNTENREYVDKTRAEEKVKIDARKAQVKEEVEDRKSQAQQEINAYKKKMNIPIVPHAQPKEGDEKNIPSKPKGDNKER